jgi:tetratricopeptide (TPR) repeat protein
MKTHSQSRVSVLLLVAIVVASAAPAWAQNPQAIELNNQAVQLHYRSDYKTALELYNQALTLSPDSREILFNRGKTHRELRNFAEALRDFEGAEALGEDTAKVQLERANVFRDQGEFRRALATYDRALMDNPDDSFVFNHRGVLYFKMGNYPRSIADFNKAIALGAGNATTYRNRSAAHLRNKQYDRAVADASEAILLDPDSSRGYFNRAQAYLETAQYKKAIADMDQAIRIGPVDAHNYFARAQMLMADRQLARALADFTKAQSLDPTNRRFVFALQQAQSEARWAKFAALPAHGIPLRKGQIEVEGSIKNWDPNTGILTLNVAAFTNDAGRRSQLPQPRTKQIRLDPKTQVRNLLPLGGVQRENLQPGYAAIVIGPELGGGKPLPASNVFLALNTLAPPAVAEGIVGRPRIRLTDGRTVNAGTAFYAGLDNGGAFLVTVRHILGVDGGLDEELKPEEIKKKIREVILLDLQNTASIGRGGDSITLPDENPEVEDNRDDLIAFRTRAAPPKNFLTFAAERPTVGAAVWIAGKDLNKPGKQTELYAASVVESEAERLVIRAEPQLNIQALSGAPVVDGEGHVVGMVLGGWRSLLMLNPAGAMKQRLQKAAASGSTRAETAPHTNPTPTAVENSVEAIGEQAQ